MEFYPLEAKSAAMVYWGSEARYVKMLEDARQQISPAPKNPNAPTKAWVSFGPARYIEYINEGQGFSYQPGYLVIDSGQTVKVERQNQRIDHLSTDVWIVPQRVGRYLSGPQLRFAVEYRNHPDFKFGFPVLAPAYGEKADDVAWLSTPNFHAAAGHPVSPFPVGLPSNWFFRWKPGTGDTPETRIVANVQIFPIEQYVLENRAPGDGDVKPVGEYAYADEALVDAVMMVLIGPRPIAEKGKSIRTLAEARK